MTSELPVLVDLGFLTGVLRFPFLSLGDWGQGREWPEPPRLVASASRIEPLEADTLCKYYYLRCSVCSDVERLGNTALAKMRPCIFKMSVA